jgi:hypothetical protein
MSAGNREDVLEPLWAVLEGRFVPYGDVVNASRKVAAALISRGKPFSLSGPGALAGVWDLERLTDDEAVAWGVWVAIRLRGPTATPTPGAKPALEPR